MTGSLEKNLNSISTQIVEEQTGAGWDHQARVIAVSKRQSEQTIREAYQLGLRDFAENYLQEAKEKMVACQDLTIRWHFIGPIQRKKLRDIVGRFHLIHSVSRPEELEKIDQLASDRDCVQDVLLQVNIANEESKTGFDVRALPPVLSAQSQWSSVQIRGFMIFPPLENSEERSQNWFRQGRQLFETHRKSGRAQMDRLSMGTSHDFHLAVREGATDLRIGARLLGPRN